MPGVVRRTGQWVGASSRSQCVVVCPGPEGHPWWGQLTCPRLQRSRRHTALHQVGPRSLAHRRRRQRLCRPGLLVGPDAVGACPSGSDRSGPGRGAARHFIWHSHRARGRVGRGDRLPHERRASAPRLIGHRGDHVGRASGPWLHRARTGREICRLLSRTPRRPVGPSRIRTGHPSRLPIGARHPRSARGQQTPPSFCPTTTRPRWSRSSRSTAIRSPA